MGRENTMEVSHDDLIYIAGFFDGEGCVYGRRPREKGCTIVRIIIAQKKPEILYWIKEILNMGKVYTYSNNSLNIPIWRVTNKKDVERFISLILPYSRVKKEELIIGRKLNNLTNSKGDNRISSEDLQKRMILYNQLKLLKK